MFFNMEKKFCFGFSLLFFTSIFIRIHLSFVHLGSHTPGPRPPSPCSSSPWPPWPVVFLPWPLAEVHLLAKSHCHTRSWSCCACHACATKHCPPCTHTAPPTLLPPCWPYPSPLPRSSGQTSLKTLPSTSYSWLTNWRPLDLRRHRRTTPSLKEITPPLMITVMD